TRRCSPTLDLANTDLYYRHNIESQKSALDRTVFRERLRRAIEVLETAVGDGHVGAWGLATWDGLRVPAEHPEHLSLRETLEAAREVAGEHHHFRGVQLPMSLAMAQAIAYRSQDGTRGRLPALLAAQEEGLATFGSASLLQGRLAADLPEEIDAAFPEARSGAQRALQFSRSAPGMTTSLVGVSTRAHAEDNFALAKIPPAPTERVMGLFEAEAQGKES